LTLFRVARTLLICKLVYKASIWISWYPHPLIPEVSLAEFSEWNIPSLMIAGRFVGMMQVEDGWFRSDPSTQTALSC